MRFIYNGHANEGGIYRITNQINGRFYIGSTCQFKVRWATHRRELLKGDHYNAFLQNDFNKCGADAFVVEVLEVIPDRDSRLCAEGTLIRQHFGDGCYNLEPEVGPHYPVNSRPRKPHTEATKEKIRQAKLGKKLPSEVEAQRVDAIRAAHATRKASGTVRISPLRGVPRTEEAKAKMRESIEKRRQNGTLVLSQEQKEHLRRVNLGKVYGPRSEETREKLKKAWGSRPRVATRGPMSEATKENIRRAKIGKPHTETARAKMSASHKGQPLSDETKAKMSAARKGQGTGRHHSEETRAKMSAAKKGRQGRPLSDETKAKISAARKIRGSKTHSEETRAKMSLAQKTRRASEKTQNGGPQ
jgi:group I intron endonuclease